MEHKKDFDHILKMFKNKYGIHKIIAFSGGANSKLSGVPLDDPLQEKFQQFSRAFEEKIIGECIGKFRGYQIAILTGGTKWGVPKTATKLAKKNGIMTIGVYPLTGKKHSLGSKFLDLSICIEPMFGESMWGYETSVFTKLLDGVIVFGGSAGTLIECSHILKMNESLKKYGHLVKYIVPISGTGGVADGLPFVWAKPEIRSLCMPNHRVLSGFEAADIIHQKLNLDDYLKDYDKSI